MEAVIQRLKKESIDKYALAEMYYSVISVLNDLDMTEREVQLVAYTAIHGNISYAVNREEFCKMHSTTSPTVNNMISRLKKIHVLIKDSGKVKVNPSIILDFNKDIVLQIKLVHGEAR